MNTVGRKSSHLYKLLTVEARSRKWNSTMKLPFKIPEPIEVYIYRNGDFSKLAHTTHFLLVKFFYPTFFSNGFIFQTNLHWRAFMQCMAEIYYLFRLAVRFVINSLNYLYFSVALQHFWKLLQIPLAQTQQPRLQELLMIRRLYRHILKERITI